MNSSDHSSIKQTPVLSKRFLCIPLAACLRQVGLYSLIWMLANSAFSWNICRYITFIRKGSANKLIIRKSWNKEQAKTKWFTVKGPLIIEPRHAHPSSLISAFVICCSDSIILLVSISEISSLYIASVAAQADLSLSWSQSPEDRFSHD